MNIHLKLFRYKAAGISANCNYDYLKQVTVSVVSRIYLNRINVVVYAILKEFMYMLTIGCLTNIR